ncbi:hypothetical protein ACFV9C_26875 [Kribbella sp. NPDC059898]|uniref:hypothetical protein n=1 Tax=Kribbella sp. NPDC059898 TaxID=3346995 RepID=UPI0036687368
MPEHDPEQELGPKITSAFHDHAGVTGMQKSGLAREARRRVHRRRQAWSVAAGAVLVAVVGGGVWGLAGSESPVASSHSDAGSAAAAGTAKSNQGIVGPREQTVCPSAPAIQQAAGPNALPAGTGLELSTPVTGLTACRYRMSDGTVLGQQSFNASVAQQVVDAIKVLPERNPALPVFKCAPQTAKPGEAIVLRFSTADGVREIWVEYDGCESPGFFTGTHTYGLYAAPLKLFMVGTVRPTGGTYLNALQGW